MKRHWPCQGVVSPGYSRFITVELVPQFGYSRSTGAVFCFVRPRHGCNNLETAFANIEYADIAHKPRRSRGPIAARNRYFALVIGHAFIGGSRMVADCGRDMYWRDGASQNLFLRLSTHDGPAQPERSHELGNLSLRRIVHVCCGRDPELATVGRDLYRRAVHPVDRRFSHIAACTHGA